MKKIIALAGAFALAACGGNDAETVDADMNDDTVLVDNTTAQPGMEYAGTYEGEDGTGEDWSITLDQDGTFTQTAGGEMTNEGSWTYTEARGLCLSDEGAAEQDCFQMGEIGGDGMVSFTGADNETYSMNKTM